MKKIIFDKFIITQLLNIFLGSLVGFICLFYFNDQEIIISQTIIAISQFSIVFLAIYMSTASLEMLYDHKDKIYKYILISILLFFLIILFNHHSLFYKFLNFLYVITLIVSEYTHIYYAKVINNKNINHRYYLILNNLSSNIFRLIIFLFFLLKFDPIIAFLFSSLISILIKSFVLIYLSNKTSSNEQTSPKIDSTKKLSNILVKLSAYFERNPTILVILAISYSFDYLDINLKNVGLAILIFNISCVVGSTMWIRYENLNIIDLKELCSYLFFIIISIIGAFIFINFIPEEMFKAQSIKLLKSNNILLVFAPIICGISYGLGVFSYGSALPLIKIFLNLIVFFFFGYLAFLIVALINILFFIIFSKLNKNN